MGFRFRRSARLGPLRFNFSTGGLSSISVGGPGASFNIPVARSGRARTTVGVPGTGLSWSWSTHRQRGYPTAGGYGRGSLRPSSSHCLICCAKSSLHLDPLAPCCGSTAV